MQGDVAKAERPAQNAPMLLVRTLRFVAMAAFVGRVYAGYKWIQLAHRAARARGRTEHRTAARLVRQHRWSAEGLYALATRLEGLPIKVCQFLGSRADILPSEYVEVLSRLQDRVPPRPLATLLPMLRDELEQSVPEAFAELDPEPIASASLAQVHRGRLHDGREVAVKIQYPEIADLVQVDLANLAVLIGILARLEPEFDFRVILREIRKYVPLELDFVHEAQNADRMRRQLAARTDVVVPQIVRPLSSRRVLVMEFMPGVRVTDVAALRRIGVEPADVARRLIDVFCEQILAHGFFHADPHPGNILVQPGGRLVLLDFGLAKDFQPGFAAGVTRLTVAILGGDRARIGAAFRALGFRTRTDDDASLAWLGEAFLGWAVRNGRSFADPKMIQQFGEEMPRVMKDNPVTEVPADVLFVGRVMGLLSGIGKQLGVDVDLATTLMPYLTGARSSA
jgi:predicted unusual protein kinase regulating ubiquinone biosynthesis (AarF/ABC1/UbiB family)